MNVEVNIYITEEEKNVLVIFTILYTVDIFL